MFEVIRDIFNIKNTMGIMLFNGKDDFLGRKVYVLEDVARPQGVKIPSETAIWEGEYWLTITYSGRFKRDMPLIYNDEPTLACISGDKRFDGGNEKKSTKSNDGISYATASKMDQFLTMISSFRSGFIMSPNIVGKSMQVAYRPNKIMSYEENEAKERFFNIFMKEYNRVSTENEIAKLKDLDGYSKRRTNYYNNKELVNYFKNEARKDSSMYKLLNGEKTLDEVKEAIKDEILKYHTEYKINELYNDIITLAEGKDKLNSVIDSMLGSKKLDVTTMDILEDNDDEVETNEENEEKPVVTLTERNEELMKENLRLLHYNTTVYNEVLLDLLYGDMSLGLKDVIDAGKRTGSVS